MKKNYPELAAVGLLLTLLLTRKFKKRAVKNFLSAKGYFSIPFFENASGHLLIPVTVNKVKGLFILDTGAGGTVVDTIHTDRLGLSVVAESTSFSGAGAGGFGMKVSLSSGNKVAIGEYKLHDFTLAVMSLEHVSQALAEIGAEEEVLGVIGVDILKPGKAIINYDDMHLYLKK